MKNAIFRTVKALDRMTARMPSCGAFQPSHGWFSAFEHLQSGRFEGQVLYALQECGPVPPQSITRISGLNQDNFQPWPAFWTLSHEATLLGNLALWREPRGLLCSEASYHLLERRRLSEDSPAARCWVKNPKTLTGAWTSIASNWGDGKNYFHWILDNLTRLMVRETLPEKTRILVPKTTAPYVHETLELLGLTGEVEEITGEPLSPERFYFCSPTAMTGVWNPAGFDWLRKSFAAHFAPVKSGSPVFLTRRGGTRIPDQVDAIEALFKSYDFEIVDCAKLTVKEQIRTLSAAPAIAGFHGAAMTNLLWSPPGTPVLELFQAEYLNGCYEQVAFQGGLEYSYHIMANGDPFAIIKTWIENNAAITRVKNS